MDEILKKTKVDLKYKNPDHVAQRLPRMYQTAKLAEKTNEESTAFIMFKKWLNVVEWIKTTKNYRENSSSYTSYFSNIQIQEVKLSLEKLEKALTLYYTPQKHNVEENDALDPKTKGPVPGGDKSTERTLNLPETPTEEPLASESNEFLSCHQLFHLIQSNSKLLIIDVRPEADYLASSIKSDQCINIPEETIKFGVIAASFEKLLSKKKEVCYRFSRRGAQYVDTVVLLDWRTTHAILFPDNKVRVLKDILQNWDSGTKCAKIKVLEGGYSEWLNCYPAYVTNSNVKAPDNLSNAMDEILEGVNYFDWLNSDDSNSPFNSLRIQPVPTKNPKAKNVEPKISILPTEKLTRDKDRAFTPDSRIAAYNKQNDSTNIFTNENDSLSRPIQMINNQDLESMLTDEDEIFSATIKFPSKSALHNVMPKPTIDRSSKPLNLTNQYIDCTNLLILTRQFFELVKAEKDFELEILKIEKSWHFQNMDDNTDRKLTKGHLEAVKTQLEEVKKKKAQVKNALTMEKVDEISMSPKDKKEKLALDLKIDTEEKRLMWLSIERKKLHESIREEEQKRHQLMSKQNENGVHKEPLKFDGASTNSGLKRSHSSPNLVQLDDRKVPHVDRSSKPHVPVPQMPNKARNSQKITQWRSKGREDRMEPVYRNVHPGITGLKNLGNSCYMNSIIQCLSNTAYLAKYFNDNMHIDHLNTSNENGTQSLVADEVAHVIKALWRGQYKSISPRDLKIVIGQYKLQFDTTEQQDSHEFLTFLLDWMHNDLKRETKMRIDGPLSPAEKEWDKAMESHRSIISDLFFGQLRSSIVCATCGNSSITYETFNSLTMSLPNTNRCTLDDCVKKYVTGQKVSGWKCPSCKVPREAMKKFDFIKLAPIVVIHLNRFAETDGWLEKKNTSVDFPLMDFNLKPYLVPDLESANTTNQSNYNYSLYAVSNHYGTMDGGHYTAYCKSATQNKWYKYDDQTVSEVERSTVKSQTSSAYLLFYTSFSSEQFAYR